MMPSMKLVLVMVLCGAAVGALANRLFAVAGDVAAPGDEGAPEVKLTKRNVQATAPYLPEDKGYL